MVGSSLEAEVKRNNIVPEYRADAESSGALTGNFTKNAHELHSKALANVAESDSPASIILSGSQQAIQKYQLAETTRKKRQREAQFISTLDRLNQRLEELDALIDEANEQLARINERRLKIGDQLEALDELDELNASGSLDTQNLAHQRIMKKAGIDPGASVADIAILISEQRAALGQEDDVLEEEGNALIKRRDELEAERNEVLIVKAEIENADTPEAIAAATERAQTVLGAQQLGQALSLSNSEDAATVVAEAVSSNDAEKDYIEKAASDDAQFFSGNDDMDWGSTPKL